MAIVYELKNINTGRVYYGSSRQSMGRFACHLRELLCGTHHNSELQSDFSGPECITFRVLRHGVSIDEASDTERELISTDVNSYNGALFSENISHVRRSSRNARIAELRKSGETLRSIASAVSCSLGTVHKALHADQ